jgi:transposase InsO family protein
MTSSQTVLTTEKPYGKAFRMLYIIDEFSRKSLAIRVARKLKAADVIEALCDLFVSRGVPAHIRSDNGPEFVSAALRVDCRRWGQDCLYRAGKSAAERLLRKLQRKAAR